MTAEQLNVMLANTTLAYCYVERWTRLGYDIRPYKQFRLGELEEILVGLQNGLDVSLYKSAKILKA